MRTTRRVTMLLVLLLVAGGVLAALPVAAQGGAWYEVTFADRPTQADRSGLEAGGATLVLPFGGNSYVAWFEADDATRFAATSPATTIEPLTPDAKILPGLESAEAAGVAAVVPSSLAEDVARTLDGVVAIRSADPAGGLSELVLPAEAADVAALAALPQVLHVGTAASALVPEDEASAQIQAGNFEAMTVPAGYETFLEEVGVDGEGVRVSVVDSGVDTMHPDLEGRVVDAQDRSVSPTGEPIDSLGHGTHVAGIVAGNGQGFAGTPFERQTDGDGRLWGLGVAPASEVVDQNYLATTASFALCGTPFWPPSPDGWEPVTREALSFDAVAWNASWHTCEGTGTGYTLSTSVLDALVRDGNASEQGDQPFGMVFSAGNSGAGSDDSSRLTVPHEGKNIITVASSNNVRAGHPDGISSFSSRGFAVDGRVKPDVAAPGGRIVSTRALPASAVCNQGPTPEAQVLYALCSGTSMAAPHVTGAVALITQWWRQLNDTDPSPALTKALLIGAATDMGERDIPNRNEGWGRVNLGDVFADTPRVTVDQSVLLTHPDETATWSITPADPDAPLRATLVWTDAPGAAGAAPALVNDLDLEVTDQDGVTYLGNVFDTGRSIAGGEANRLDNVENVFLDLAGDGPYTITVRAFNLPGDGVPSAGDDTDQDFALIITNAELSAP